MIFIVIIFVIAIAFYIYYLSHGNYSEQTPSEQPPATLVSMTAPTSLTAILRTKTPNCFTFAMQEIQKPP